MRVAGDLPQVAGPDAEQVHRLVHAGVDLVGGVDHTRRGPSPRPSSRTLPGVIALRAAASAMKLAIEPPEARMPCAPAGKPISSQSQRTTRFSTWTAAWSPPQQFGFIAEAM